MAIAYVHDLEVTHGEVVRLSPLVQCVTAPNTGYFTYTGTGTFIIGGDEVAVIDPGPLIDSHLAALLGALDGRKVSAILITHTHIDHYPLAVPLAAETGAPVMGFDARGAGTEGDIPDHQAEGGGSPQFQPTELLSDGAIVEGPGWKLSALHTPGHASDHLCFHFAEENTLFSGDHIMGWSTTIVSPPDGEMSAYLESLEKIRALEPELIRPTHGPAITKPVEFIDTLVAHRLEREVLILLELNQLPLAVGEIVEAVYTDVRPELHAAAARSTLAHLIRLIDLGDVKLVGERLDNGRFIAVDAN